VHPEGLEPPTLGSEDPQSVSPTSSHDSQLALRAPTVVSELGTPSPVGDISVIACQLATLAQLWLQLPADLRTAIMLMVQPWAHSNTGNSHAPLPQQGDSA
jgi:hypothetical protein